MDASREGSARISRQDITHSEPFMSIRALRSRLDKRHRCRRYYLKSDGDALYAPSRLLVY